MMRLRAVLALSICLIIGSTFAGDIKDCTPESSPVEIKDVIISPDPIIVGQETNVTLKMKTGMLDIIAR